MTDARRHAMLLAGLAAVICGCGSRPPARVAVRTATTPSGIEMVLLPAGEFVMGDDGGDDDERPAHTVRVSSFWIDRHELTQRAYQALMGRNPSKSIGPDKPVERVSWLFAAKYCNARSLKEGLAPCYHPQTLACDFRANGYRLPTEAEWEYACRAASTGRYSFGSDPARLARHGWFKDNAGGTTHPVAQKPPSPWDLYDMHGNVWEWCNDYYAERYEPGAGGVDPRGPASGEERVLRGGSWRDGADRCRCAARYSEPPGFADVCFGYEAYGFRCVKSAPADQAR